MARNESSFIDWLTSEPGRLVLAGSLGGIVRWITTKDRWQEGLGGIIVGAICASYLGPLVVPVFASTIGKFAPGGDIDGFTSFVVGVGGMSVAGFIIGVWEDWREFRKRKK